MNEFYNRNVVEAALLAAGKPLQIAELGQLFDENTRPKVEDIRATLDALAAEYSNRGLEVKETAAGFRIQVRREFASEISRLWPERPARYSRALLETLALIAYRQPITRAEIESVRGVAVNPNIVKTVIERNWVRVVGHRDVPGRPELLGTTREFLDYFGLRSLDELPPLAELKAMGDYNLQLELPNAGALGVEGEAGDGVVPAVAGLLTSDLAGADGEGAAGAAGAGAETDGEVAVVDVAVVEVTDVALDELAQQADVGSRDVEAEAAHDAVADAAGVQDEAAPHAEARAHGVEGEATHDAAANGAEGEGAHDAVADAAGAHDESGHHAVADASGADGEVAHDAVAGALGEHDATAHHAVVDANSADDEGAQDAVADAVGAHDAGAHHAVADANGAEGEGAHDAAADAVGEHDAAAHHAVSSPNVDDIEADRTLSSRNASKHAADSDDSDVSEPAIASESPDALEDAADDDSDDDELSADGHGSRELVAAPRDIDD
jgi:segregation and condensation protein B